MNDPIVWILLFPLLGAVACGLSGSLAVRIAYPLAVMSMAGAAVASALTLVGALSSPLREVSYVLGSWSMDLFPRGVGIEFRADLLGALIALVVTGVGFLVAVYSKVPVSRETPGKEQSYYCLMLLQIAGLAGIPLTGDAFNLYVLKIGRAHV